MEGRLSSSFDDRIDGTYSRSFEPWTIEMKKEKLNLNPETIGESFYEKSVNQASSIKYAYICFAIGIVTAFLNYFGLLSGEILLSTTLWLLLGLLLLERHLAYRIFRRIQQSSGAQSDDTDKPVNDPENPKNQPDD